MTNSQFHLILALLFFIAANGMGSTVPTAIGYVMGIYCCAAAAAWSFLERRK